MVTLCTFCFYPFPFLLALSERSESQGWVQGRLSCEARRAKQGSPWSSPRGEGGGAEQVNRLRRGGSWSNTPHNSRSANRSGNTLDKRENNNGLRKVLSFAVHS